jgi:hypothetical protein
MTPLEYAVDFDADLRSHIENTPRRAQKERGEIGASDFDCTQRMAYILARKPETDSTDYWAAYVGTAMDDRLKASRRAAKPDLLHDLIIPVTLQLEDGSEFTFNLAPDEADPTEPSVTDYKTADGLAKARKDRVHDARRRQRHLQYLAMVQNFGWPEDGIVRNVIVDRAGKDSRHFVEQETFSWEVVREARDMLSSALYAAKHNEPTSQDRPRAFCQSYCPYFTRCRGAEVEYQILADESTIALAEAYRQAQDDRQEADQLMQELRDLLPKVTGIAGRAQMRWTTANLKSGPSERLEVSWLTQPKETA